MAAARRPNWFQGKNFNAPGAILVKLNYYGRWCPYISGALSGLLLVLSVWLTGKFFGASTTFARTAGAIERAAWPDRTAGLAYFAPYAQAVDWQTTFWLGIVLGSFAASMLSGSFRWQGVPDMWEDRFGDSKIKRGAAAFFGGAIALFGARMAGGCPTGHGLSGLAQLSVSGLISLTCFFIAAVVVARLLYKGNNYRWYHYTD